MSGIRRLSHHGCWGIAFALTAGPTLAQRLPGFIEYLLRAETSLQSQSNPLRLAYGLGNEHKPDTVATADVSLAAIVPLGSDDTRLLLSGTLGDARYQTHPELDHQPRRLDAVFQWRLGDLLRGSAGLGEGEDINASLALSAPARDVITSRSAFADAGLRISESLTLPVVSVGHTTQRYEFARNATLYDRDEEQVQVAARYNGIDNSYVQAGWLQSQVRFGDRTPGLAALVDDRYRDREFFLESLWTYSIKTAVAGRLGYRRRVYGTLAERNTSLVNASVRADWQYSPKTEFELGFWNRPYSNEEIPTILYSTLTGGRASVRWQADDKQWLSFNVVREFQQDTRTPGEEPGSSRAWRAGARWEWLLDRNVKLVLDGWRESVRGQNYPSFSNNVVRLGLVISHDNGGTHAPERLLRSRDCNAPRYVESTSCYD